MATRDASPANHASALDRWRRLQECLHSLTNPGWDGRLHRLATHMAMQRLVRARGNAGASLRRLDLAVLREALCRLLRQGADEGYLIYQLVVQGTEPSVVATERGVSQAVLVEQLRYAVDQLAMEYEDVAYAAVGGSKHG